MTCVPFAANEIGKYIFMQTKHGCISRTFPFMFVLEQYFSRIFSGTPSHKLALKFHKLNTNPLMWFS